ncbi:hypothetical protein P154DRAFT_120478 [Amniculicola lignicola CBS 123094]|uniref:Uncharacterized protein n=1 Tax=Amniculicola lignicola CBS 123094 TaxID=1392246 RepID=A0A6A5X3T7_9PLEO|nr:hypothetical protein P154DRAFT_120478 [Amniculicola lignicola CBS 123094]
MSIVSPSLHGGTYYTILTAALTSSTLPSTDSIPRGKNPAQKPPIRKKNGPQNEKRDRTPNPRSKRHTNLSHQRPDSDQKQKQESNSESERNDMIAKVEEEEKQGKEEEDQSRDPQNHHGQSGALIASPSPLDPPPSSWESLCCYTVSFLARIDIKRFMARVDLARDIIRRFRQC